jgi:NADH dehydrogenase (ubiquinone) 1 alpha subcomplex subunit 9
MVISSPSAIPRTSSPCACAVAIMNSLTTWDALGKTYHLAGPDVFTIKQLVEFMYQTIREPYSATYMPAGVAMQGA